MYNKIFIPQKNKKIYTFILISLLLLFIFIYLISFFLFINKKYFFISSLDNNYFIIPEDKEGEKVKFINKKGINNYLEINKNNPKNNFFLNNLKYTIQLFSDNSLKNVEKYQNKILNLKSEIISKDDLYIFSIKSQIGIDYFLTYNNFETRSRATSFCKNLSFIKKCLIINLNN